MKHPLINKIDSSHYDSTKTPAILDFEREYTTGELRAWAKLSKAKYEHPARANKGQVESDKRKAKTYSDYYDMLNDVITRYPYLADVSAVTAYDILKYRWEY